ncbi:MAG: GNAT family N-acetyltransferase, partial [Minwuiales bacterium]|nr:GNAT family N-acetyltransferase [Minwuiales bacterium]
VRITADPNHESAEYAVVMADEMAGMGLGRLLMQRIIDYARSRGLTELCGRVLRENEAMLGLCRDLGFRVTADLDDPGVMSVNLAL